MVHTLTTFHGFQKNPMSRNARQFLQSALIFIAAVAFGLITAWMIIRRDQPEKSAGPLEYGLHTQR